jgi:hypothetical protein
MKKKENKKNIKRTNLILVFFLVLASAGQVYLFFFRNKKTLQKPAYKNTLHIGETLKAGEMLTSANDAYILKIQAIDGNLCIYKNNRDVPHPFIWCSMKSGFKKGELILQTDGNLVVFAEHVTQWSSKTHPNYLEKFKDTLNKPVKLVLENDGSIKLYTAKGTIVWSSEE